MNRNNNLKAKVTIIPMFEYDDLRNGQYKKKYQKGVKMEKFELTGEEKKMFKMYATGKKIKYIAEELNLSPRIISKKMDKVALKLNIDEDIPQKKIAAVCILLKQGLI